MLSVSLPKLLQDCFIGVFQLSLARSTTPFRLMLYPRVVSLSPDHPSWFLLSASVDFSQCHVSNERNLADSPLSSLVPSSRIHPPPLLSCFSNCFKPILKTHLFKKFHDPGIHNFSCTLFIFTTVSAGVFLV